MTKVFIDGGAGTTGLRIRERLSARGDLALITLSEENRKSLPARKEALNEADVAFLCLPDAAAIEAVSLVENDKTVVIDTSTAHRTSPGWTYGFPELAGYRERIAASKRIANPGCHAGGFIALVQPLTEARVLPKDALLTCFSLTGYSGGGKKMIAEYESDPPAKPSCPGMYGLTQEHKHLPEMQKICALENAPVFCPVVSDYYAGMQVTVPLFASQVKGGETAVREVYKERYPSGLVRYVGQNDGGQFLYANALAGRDDMEISVEGNGERILLVARFDNLGKGASGAAIQNMNIVLGLEEDTGLCVK